MFQPKGPGSRPASRNGVFTRAPSARPGMAPYSRATAPTECLPNLPGQVQGSCAACAWIRGQQRGDAGGCDPHSSRWGPRDRRGLIDELAVSPLFRFPHSSRPAPSSRSSRSPGALATSLSRKTARQPPETGCATAPRPSATYRSLRSATGRAPPAPVCSGYEAGRPAVLARPDQPKQQALGLQQEVDCSGRTPGPAGPWSWRPKAVERCRPKWKALGKTAVAGGPGGKTAPGSRPAGRS